ncbi:DUF4276 family protein [Streptomyces sp. ADMS]|uniref:DUF4276 family protein n=1 Tax=Streptomyces sp. ADMS TaxID=3071415 RepID=UPI00296FDC04|nr:DUF4276 family protein [Streptomyces sp. ADMS]MDW4908742.1 DUF4276 family protein [Streptomyces sp. ADMS]
MKRIGVVTEGESEVKGLPEIYPALEERVGSQLLRPIRSSVDPLSPIPVLTKGLRTGIQLSLARNAQLVVVLLDRENSETCAGARAADIERRLREEVDDVVRVVIKDRTFENWLIASPEAFIKQRSKYSHPERISRAACPNKADRHDAPCDLINSAMTKGRYDKTADAPRILRFSNLDSMAANSRSFRRFLAVLGDPKYASGSKRP